MEFLLYSIFKDVVLKGPRLFGFFQSKDESDICEALTSVASMHWMRNQQECSVIIHDYIISYIVVFSFLVKLYIIICTFRLFFQMLKNAISHPGRTCFYYSLSDLPHRSKQD